MSLITEKGYEELKEKASRYNTEEGSALRILGRDKAKDYIKKFLSDEPAFDSRRGGLCPTKVGLRQATPLYVHWSIIKGLNLKVLDVLPVTRFLEDAFASSSTMGRLLSEMTREQRIARTKNQSTGAWHYGSTEEFLN